MQTKQTLRGVKERNYIRQWLGASILALAIFMLGFCLIPTLISEASATQDVSAFASWSPVSLTLDPDYGSSNTSSSRGNVVFGSITPTSRDTSSGSYGTQRVIKKTIGITSNGTYYTVFLSTSGSDNSLALDMENTDLSIPAIGNGSTTGVWSNPVAFSASGWGFSVPGTAIPASADAVGTSASSTPPAFTDVVTGANLGKDLTKALDSSIYNQDIWSAVPSSSTPQQIWKATSTSANGFGTYTNSNNVEVTGDLVNDHFDIYYGIMVDTDVLSGTYENEIVYTALASATSLDDVSTNLSRETYIIANGTEQTLHFDLSSSLANPTNIINKDNITIYLVPHATVASANYELTSTIKNAASTYTTCTISSNDDITITGDGNGATLTCTSPDNTPADGTGTGEFDYWLHIDGYNYNYLSHYKKNEQDTATVAYIGLQSKLTDSNNELVITEMQEMTGAICKNTNMWNNIVGNGARILDSTGTTGLVADILDENDEVDIDETLAANKALGIGSFKLKDNRDNTYYLVRRYVDDNCWMTQNMGLNLASFAFTDNLNETNTDLSTARTDLPTNENGIKYWDPAKSMYDAANTIVNREGYTGPALTQNNYFEIASLDLLSETQHYQYRNIGTNDGSTFWGSKYYYDEELGTKELGTDILANEYAEMPRAYGDTYRRYNNNNTDSEWIEANASRYIGYYYNWYAATTEEGSYSMTTGFTNSSICPKGWQLPSAPNDSSKGFYRLFNMLFYNDGSGNYVKVSEQGTAAVAATRATPLELGGFGVYAQELGRTNSTQISFWSSYPKDTTYAYRLYAASRYINNKHTNPKSDGMGIRCVARD